MNPIAPTAPESSPDPAQDLREVRAGLLRDFVFEALQPVENDNAATLLCLKNDDDAGAKYHLKRVVECVKAAVKTFRELEALTEPERKRKSA